MKDHSTPQFDFRLDGIMRLMDRFGHTKVNHGSMQQSSQKINGDCRRTRFSHKKDLCLHRIKNVVKVTHDQPSAESQTLLNSRLDECIHKGSEHVIRSNHHRQIITESHLKFQEITDVSINSPVRFVNKFLQSSSHRTLEGICLKISHVSKRSSRF